MQTVYLAATSPVVRRETERRSQSDRSLVAAIAAGNRLAMRTLYGRHSARAYRFAVRLTGDAAIAEDVVSEVFLAVWQQAGRFEHRSEVLTWLLAIARYQAISARRQRRYSTLDDAAVHDIVDPAEDPHDALEQKHGGALLRRCFAELSVEHREIIDLVYYHQKSMKEAAAIVGIPCNTVKTRLFNARKQLRRLLEDAQVATLNAA